MSVWEICLILWAFSLIGYLVSIPIAIKSDNLAPMYTCSTLMWVFVAGQFIALTLDI